MSDSLFALVTFYQRFPEAAGAAAQRHHPDVRTKRCLGCELSTRLGPMWPCMISVAAAIVMDAAAHRREVVIPDDIAAVTVASHA